MKLNQTLKSLYFIGNRQHRTVLYSIYYIILYVILRIKKKKLEKHFVRTRILYGTRMYTKCYNNQRAYNFRSRGPMCILCVVYCLTNPKDSSLSLVILRCCCCIQMAVFEPLPMYKVYTLSF